MKKFTFYASSFSVIGEETSNPYLSITFRMFSTMKNRNSGVVTEGFIDDIIANADQYVCLPLLADVDKIERGDLNTLGHNYDPNTGEFDTEEIGSFFSFEKVTDEFGVSLMGTARIPKRNAAVCEAIKFLYSQKRLCVSFEIETPDVSYMEDGTYVIDRSEGNKLIGMTVVSVPAYSEAVALTLVAETNEENPENNEERQDNENEDVEDDSQEDQQDDLTDDDELDGEKTMTLEEAMARIAELEAEAQTNAHEMANKIAELEASQTTVAEKDNMISEKDTEIQNLQSQVAELTPYKEQVEAAEAEAARIAHENKVAELKAYASEHGLNVEDETIAQAIIDMNYELIVNETMKAEAAAKEVKAAEAEKKEDPVDKEDSAGVLSLYASMVISNDNDLYERV